MAPTFIFDTPSFKSPMLIHSDPPIAMRHKHPAQASHLVGVSIFGASMILLYFTSSFAHFWTTLFYL